MFRFQSLHKVRFALDITVENCDSLAQAVRGMNIAAPGAVKSQGCRDI